MLIDFPGGGRREMGKSERRVEKIKGRKGGGRTGKENKKGVG